MGYLSLVVCLLVTFQVTAAYPVGDMRNCRAESSYDGVRLPSTLDVLPGLGFDALRNTDMGQVLIYSYSLCQISKNGLYLLPDNVYMTPVRESRVNVYAEYFDHWDQVTSLTSKTINVHASHHWVFGSIGGSYSSEYMSTKSSMVNYDSVVVRIHIRNKLYAVHVQPRTLLHPDFKSRIFEIAAYLEKNDTSHTNYLAELLVRDYGTHYLTAVEAGAIISQSDFISRQYAEDKSTDSSKKTIKAKAQVSFLGIFKTSVGFSDTTTTSNSNDDGYASNRTFSVVDTHGGPPFRVNSTIDEWEAGIAENLVPIDRAGDPLHFAINSNTVPELPYAMRGAVIHVIYEAIKRYFKVNTHTGCTNHRSKHFDFNANVDDGSCDTDIVYSNYTFGGTYQLCTGSDSEQCSAIIQPNPLTHGYSCPDDVNYIPVKMFSGSIEIRPRFDFFWFLYHVEHIPYETYWCVARPGTTIPANSGFLFGGFYTDSTPNPLTNTMHCPPYFNPLMIGNYLHVCVSTDFELGFRYSVPFGGFDTCQSGNPLIQETFNDDPSVWPHQCPHGYTRHFGGVENGCEINLCVKSGTLKATNYFTGDPPKLPPFHFHSQVNHVNNTDTLTFVASDGNLWSRSWSGEWSKNKEPASQCLGAAEMTTEQEVSTEQTTSSVYTTPDSSTAQTEGGTTQNPSNSPLGNDGPSTVAVTVPSILIGVLVLCVVVAIFAVIAYHAHKHRHHHGYTNISHTPRL